MNGDGAALHQVCAWRSLGGRLTAKQVTRSLPAVTHSALSCQIWRIFPIVWDSALSAWVPLLWNSLCGHWPLAVQACAVFRCTSPRAMDLQPCMFVCVSSDARSLRLGDLVGSRDCRIESLPFELSDFLHFPFSAHSFYSSVSSSIRADTFWAATNQSQSPACSRPAQWSQHCALFGQNVPLQTVAAWFHISIPLSAFIRAKVTRLLLGFPSIAALWAFIGCLSTSIFQPTQKRGHRSGM